MISVAIVTARRSLSRDWQAIISDMADAQCVGSFSNVAAITQLSSSSYPDVVLLGLEAADTAAKEVQSILSLLPNVLVLVLAPKVKDEQLFAALRAGANGYLEQSVFSSQLKKAIVELYQGGAPLSKAASQRVLASFRAHRSSDNLSEREQEVYSLLCEGKNHKEIAEALFLSPHTVRFHLKKIYKKLGVNSRHEAMRLAFKP